MNISLPLISKFGKNTDYSYILSIILSTHHSTWILLTSHQTSVLAAMWNKLMN